VKAEEFKEGLKIFKEKEEVLAREVEEPVLLGGVQENILFYNPLEGTVRPQSRLLWRAIKEVISGV
jgi:AAA+ ATPase superfamily predicted ATPase